MALICSKNLKQEVSFYINSDHSLYELDAVIPKAEFTKLPDIVYSCFDLPVLIYQN